MKVTGCLSVCLSVPKDFANLLTDMVLLYYVALHEDHRDVATTIPKLFILFIFIIALKFLVILISNYEIHFY